ncbi:MAG: deoxyribonuclease IV [Armatimonadota bacterium]|nr:deoxyribonuclease IV [Armatimonadota bacterium]
MRFGAHVSVRDSLDLAVDRAVAIGCECLQIFYGSPRQWRQIRYPDDVLDRFVQKRRRARLDPLVAHAAYLLNLAAPEAGLRRRSVDSLAATLRGVERLEGLGAVTHLGSRMEAPRRAALRRVAASVRAALDATARAMVLLENSAGAGGSLGAAFEDLAEVLDLLGGHPRVAVCLDTAHLFAAGWDLRTPAGVDAMVEAADRLIGWSRVRLFHLNDSAGALGSGVDRHANIGEGWIGLDGFRATVTHPRIRPLPGIIETPGFDRTGPDRMSLARLRRLAGGGRRAARTAPARGRIDVPSHAQGDRP